jgi:DNA-binding PucR family transcriptional regulator
MGPLEFFATSAQRTLGRLIRDDARAVVAADLRGDGVLAETLETYVDCGLHATHTAERLHVHVNTVQYRLRRLAERSGCDTRLVPDVLELLLAIRVARAEAAAAGLGADQRPQTVPS